jgi:NAD(P)-dependent dehydrogenase (short-subunit alcohol dehydrogenase family)
MNKKPTIDQPPGVQPNNGQPQSRQHAVVTGGASGIGEAIAESMAATGMRITLMGRNPERLQTTAKRLNASSQQVDVSKAADVQRGFAAAVAINGPVSILINNAGAAESSPFTKMDDAMWDKMLAVNLTGTYLCTKAVIEGMSKAGYGRVINIASTAAQKGYAYVSAYCAAKHGVLGLTRALALEMAHKGVTVNAVCPGFTDTDMVARSLDTIVESTGMQREQALAELVKNNPQGRLIQPAEVAEAVLWLCQPNSGSITGQAISVAGGET